MSRKKDFLGVCVLRRRRNVANDSGLRAGDRKKLGYQQSTICWHWQVGGLIKSPLCHWTARLIQIIYIFAIFVLSVWEFSRTKPIYMRSKCTRTEVTTHPEIWHENLQRRLIVTKPVVLTMDAIRAMNRSLRLIGLKAPASLIHDHSYHGQLMTLIDCACIVTPSHCWLV